MKKILFISGIQIFPPESGGQLRSANLCRTLVSLGHTVSIYSFTGRKDDYLNHRPSEELEIQNHLTEFINRNKLFGALQFISYKLRLPPFWLTLITYLLLPKTLKNKIKSHDLIIADFPFLYPVSSHGAKPFYLNTHNAEFELYKNKFFSTVVKKIELKGFSKAVKIFFCGPSDRDKFVQERPDLSKKSFIIPNGVDLASFNFNQEERNKIRKGLNISDLHKVLLFTGSQYAPNVEVLDFLKIWCNNNKDLLIKMNVVILVGGTVGKELIDTPYFKVVGKVESMMPYFSASDYGLNLVNSGSGTNVKMIEFMAAKLPIITTFFGTRGLKLEHKKSCWMTERDNLIVSLEEIIQQDGSERVDMSQTALQDNMDSVDMITSMKTLTFA